MVAFAKVKAGDVLWDCRMQRMGNTTMSRLTCWTVRVIEVTDTHAMCSWNGNPPQRYAPYQFNRLRRTQKEPRA